MCIACRVKAGEDEGGALNEAGTSGQASSAPLPEVAQRLRDATKRLLAREGYGAVTIGAIARESGEYRGSIAYYFGGKSGLLAAVADSICPREACVGAVAGCEAYPPGPERVHAQMAALRAMAEDRDAFRAFFELYPHILRDDELRKNLTALYDWYRELDERMFGVSTEDPEELKYAASVVLAAVDGLAFQACLDPEKFDLVKAFGALERMISVFLRDLMSR
jgi:AcrR family transcriptional regulator